MNTKLLMIASALFLGITGILFSFLPEEIATYLNIEPRGITILMFQISGALYMGFGILNWTVKDSLIGGIYNKPIILANLLHFSVGAITLVKVVFGANAYREMMLPLTGIYVIFTVLFIYIFRTHPVKEEEG